MIDSIQQWVLSILESIGAIRGGHFVLANGNHSDRYVDKNRLFAQPRITEWMSEELARFARTLPPEIVVGPAIGGALLAQRIAFQLGRLPKREVRFAYAEKDGNIFVLKRGYDQLVARKRVLVVDDVINTGASVREVVKAVRAAGGIVKTVVALCNRGGATAEDIGEELALHVLLELSLQQWPAEECPLCAEGVPVNTDVGHGAEFVEQQSRGVS